MIHAGSPVEVISDLSMTIEQMYPEAIWDVNCSVIVVHGILDCLSGDLSGTLAMLSG